MQTHVWVWNRSELPMTLLVSPNLAELTGPWPHPQMLHRHPYTLLYPPLPLGSPRDAWGGLGRRALTRVVGDRRQALAVLLLDGGCNWATPEEKCLHGKRADDSEGYMWNMPLPQPTIPPWTRQGLSLSMS